MKRKESEYIYSQDKHVKADHLFYQQTACFSYRHKCNIATLYQETVHVLFDNPHRPSLILQKSKTLRVP